MADRDTYLEESYDDNLTAFDLGDGNVVLSDGCRLMRVPQQQHEPEANVGVYGRQSIPMMMMPFGSSYRPQYPPPAFYFAQMQQQSTPTDCGALAYHYQQQQPTFLHPIMIYKDEPYATPSPPIDLEDSIDSGNGRATPETTRAARDRSMDENGSGTDAQSPCRKRKRFTTDQTKQLENIFANRRSKWRRIEKTSCGDMPPKAQYGLLGAITKHAIKQGTVDREYNTTIADRDTMQHPLINAMMTTENGVKTLSPN